jgi:hypothetical protein
MATITDENLVETPSKAAKPADAGAANAAKKTKKKKAKKASRRTQIGTLRLQIAAQLLAPSYGDAAAAGGLGKQRLESALKVANELLELNSTLQLPKTNKGSKEGKEPREGKGRSQ